MFSESDINKHEHGIWQVKPCRLVWSLAVDNMSEHTMFRFICRRLVVTQFSKHQQNTRLNKSIVHVGYMEQTDIIFLTECNIVVRQTEI